MPEELQDDLKESSAFMTQAKKRRAEAEKARGLFKKGTDPVARDERMRDLKSRLPCKACGKLGHWKDDDACPRKASSKSAHLVSIFMVKGR